MSFQANQMQRSNLLACFSSFEGAYCVRKLTEFISSSLLLTITVIATIAYIYKFRFEKRLWMLSVLLLMLLSLLVNILFCLYNEEYWLYALQSYFCNLYFLVMVGYVCQAYLLKSRNKMRESTSNRERMKGLSLVEQKNWEKIVFYVIFISLLTLYTSIFIVSMIKELKSQVDDDSAKGVRYCQEVEYLIFDVLCTIMSIVVLIILYKNQQEEKMKMQQLSFIGRDRPRGSLLSQENSQKKTNVQYQVFRENTHNPLVKVWIWIAINISSQIINLVESGLLLKATPSQCLIISSNPTASNYLELLFTFLTLDMGYIATLWYIILIKLIREKSAIDRTVIFSQQVKIEGNIQLFLPSREETIFV